MIWPAGRCWAACMRGRGAAGKLAFSRSSYTYSAGLVLLTFRSDLFLDLAARLGVSSCCAAWSMLFLLVKLCTQFNSFLIVINLARQLH